MSRHERQYKNGSDPGVLDVIDVPVLNEKPKYFQQENWLLDPDYYWKRVRRMTRDTLHDLVDPAASLWVNGYRSTNGMNNRIPDSIANVLNSSLRLIRVDRLDLDVGQWNNQRRVRGRFRCGGTNYWLWVTDPVYKRKYLRRPDGSYQIGESYLTISLGESFLGYAYKLIAAIIEC